VLWSLGSNVGVTPNMTADANFFDDLKPLETLSEALDGDNYVAAPDDWLIVAGDVMGSTQQVADGRQRDVNFTAAGLITALVNSCGQVPFQFAGDGAVVLVPPQYAAIARRALARLRRFARTDLDVVIRIGAVPVGVLTARGAKVLVARFEPTPGNPTAHFLGDGPGRLETAIKGRGDAELARLAEIADSEDDGEPPDLTGLSCRWNPLRPVKGRIVALVLRGADHAKIYQDLLRLTGLPILRAASEQSLVSRWPPPGLLREARARRRGKPLVTTLLRLLLDTLFAWLVFGWNLNVGRFDPRRYRHEIIANLLDFSRCGDALNIVFDCPVERIAQIEAYLAAEAAAKRLSYGIHVADHALMTCLVRDASDGLHVHFADGGDGGYTRAAIQLKAALAKG